MEEKVYKTMRGTGAANIAIGILTMIVGVATGVLPFYFYYGKKEAKGRWHVNSTIFLPIKNIRPRQSCPRFWE